MIFDIPEVLALGLTAVALWIGAGNWIARRKRR
jgi:hypothetical protein